jgi:hypothetical protein
MKMEIRITLSAQEVIEAASIIALKKNMIIPDGQALSVKYPHGMVVTGEAKGTQEAVVLCWEKTAP